MKTKDKKVLEVANRYATLFIQGKADWRDFHGELGNLLK